MCIELGLGLARHLHSFIQYWLHANVLARVMLFQKQVDHDIQL